LQAPPAVGVGGDRRACLDDPRPPSPDLAGNGGPVSRL